MTEHKCEDCKGLLADGGPVGLYCIDDDCNKRERRRIFDAMRKAGLFESRPFVFPAKL